MRTATLGEIADWGSGGTPKRSVAEYFGAGTPWLSIADLNDGVVTTAKEFLTASGIANSSAKVVPPGTIFIAMYGSIGKLGIAGSEMATSQAIAFAKPKDDVVDRRFLFHYLLSERPKLQSLGRGGTQMNIGQADLKAWPVPLPSLPEQRRIAAILDHADALRSKRRQVLSHLAALSGSVFRAAFADVADTARLGDVATTTSGGTPNRSVSANYGGGIPWVKSGELHAGLVTETEETISTQGLSSSSAKLLPTGTVLLAMYGATAGVVGRLGIDAATNQAVCAVTPGPSLNAEYLIAALRAQNAQLVAKAAGGAQPNLSQGIIRDILIPLPSLEDQQRFSSQVALIEAQRSSVVGARTMDDELLASLQARAFRGEL